MFEATRRRVIAALGALLLPISVRAGEQRPALRMTMVNLLPWAGYTPQGQPTGALIELSAQLAKLSGLPIETVLVPYGRAPYMLGRGGSELMLAIDISTPGAPIESAGTVEVVLFGRSDFRFAQLDSLHGKTVGHLRGTHYLQEFDTDERIRKYPVDSYEQAVRMLRAGRLDVIIGVSDSIEYALHKLGADAGPVSARFLLTRANLALYGDPQLDSKTVAALQAACRQLRQRRTLETLLGRR